MRKHKRSQGRSAAFVAAYGTQPINRTKQVLDTPPKPAPTIEVRKVNTSRLSAEELAFLAEKAAVELML